MTYSSINDLFPHYHTTFHQSHQQHVLASTRFFELFWLILEYPNINFICLSILRDIYLSIDSEDEVEDEDGDTSEDGEDDTQGLK